MNANRYRLRNPQTEVVSPAGRGVADPKHVGFPLEDISHCLRRHTPSLCEFVRGEVLLIDNEIGVRLTLVDEFPPESYADGLRLRRLWVGDQLRKDFDRKSSSRISSFTVIMTFS